MKTIKLTDDQFETLFHFVDERVEDDSYKWLYINKLED